MNDWRTILLGAILGNRDEIEKEHTAVDKLTKNVVQSLNVPQGKWLGKSAALSKLLELANKLENRLGRLISRHSVRWWLFSARKLPLEIFVPNQMYSTSVQIRWTFDRSVVKYGSTSNKDIVQKACGSWVPEFYAPADLKNFFRAFYLAQNLYFTASCFRRVSKGARLRFVGSSCECPATPDADSLMRLFDERKQRYGDFLDLFGTPYHVGNVTDERSKSIEPFIPLANFLANDYEEAMQVDHTFRPVFLSLERVRDAVLFWDELGIQIRGFQPTVLVTLLSALSLSRWAPETKREYQNHTQDVMLRDLAVNAYSTVLHGAVEDDQKYYMMHIGEFQTPALYKNKPGDIDSLVRRFLAEFGDRRSLDVHYGTNSPIVVSQESVDLIDWLAVWASIRGWTGELTLSERTKVGTLRGIMFESKVRAFLERQLGAALTFWPPRERPRSEPERLRRRDVDLAVILDDVIVLVECKVKIGKEAAVTNVSPLEHQEEWQRSLWKGARKWLSQVDETASALATGHATTDGHTLPPSIRFVVPVVCSPIVAYIGMTDPEYFLTPNIPRVCTPRELVELLKLGTSIALNCPAVHKVARR